MQEVSNAELDAAIARARAHADTLRPPRARKQLRIDASALLATLKLPADISYVNAALNPIPSIFNLLGLEDDRPEYARTMPELEQVAALTGGITSGQTSPLEPQTVYYDLNAIHANAKLGAADSTIENVLAHETVHLAQYARMQRAGKDPMREVLRQNITHTYADNPAELDAFKRAPALAHLVKVG